MIYVDVYLQYKLCKTILNYTKIISRRLFNKKERAALFVTARGICEECGEPLQKLSQMQGDHNIPFSKGGATVLSNGRAVCKTCNKKKASSLPAIKTASPQKQKTFGLTDSYVPRRWIQGATKVYFERDQANFLCVSCPSSGKTYFSNL